MAHSTFDDPEEKPLDPALLRVQARLKRLMLVAGLTLGIGILAVIVAVIYRVSVIADKPPASGAPIAATASLPAGARLISSTSAGDRIVLTYETPSGTLVVLVDPRDLSVTGRLALTPE